MNATHGLDARLLTNASQFQLAIPAQSLKHRDRSLTIAAAEAFHIHEVMSVGVT